MRGGQQSEASQKLVSHGPRAAARPLMARAAIYLLLR